MEEDGALADPADAELREVGGPLVERGAVGRRVGSEVLVPAGGVLERVGSLQPDHPRVTARALQPADEALVGIVLGLGEPADEQRCEAVVGERGGGLLDDAPESSSAGRPPSRYCQRDSGETT